jgi:hypothetical protein
VCESILHSVCPSRNQPRAQPVCKRMSGPMPTHTEVFVDDGEGEEDEVPGLVARCLLCAPVGKNALVDAASAL